MKPHAPDTLQVSVPTLTPLCALAGAVNADARATADARTVARRNLPIMLDAPQVGGRPPCPTNDRARQPSASNSAVAATLCGIRPGAVTIAPCRPRLETSAPPTRSEERRVGKECRSRWS